MLVPVNSRMKFLLTLTACRSLLTLLRFGCSAGLWSAPIAKKAYLRSLAVVERLQKRRGEAMVQWLHSI